MPVNKRCPSNKRRDGAGAGSKPGTGAGRPAASQSRSTSDFAMHRLSSYVRYSPNFFSAST
ncbi:hypothetical protein BX264_2841 [Streptomyces sp. 2333.5]|nr:hypothetical protein BX264_2841 [Streptomyces sp. 2333.5]SED12797.1 hypothetical protein SAMN05428943_2981 [Streptomyces sp. 2314.4]SED99972.1 hypothetical protein SAMN05428942_2944 [Streptomyces sp. 2112.2]